MKISDVSKFEKQNEDLSIDVFGLDKGLYPLYISKKIGYAIVNLLLITYKNDPVKNHKWVKDLARILNKNSKQKHRKHPCSRALRESSLKSHVEDCQGISEKAQRIEMPKYGENLLKFANHHEQMRVPYIIYADFEALNQSM